ESGRSAVRIRSTIRFRAPSRRGGACRDSLEWRAAEVGGAIMIFLRPIARPRYFDCAQHLKHAAKKWKPVFRPTACVNPRHAAKKWKPVFRPAACALEYAAKGGAGFPAGRMHAYAD